MEDLWPPILYRARGGGESDFDRGRSRVFSGLKMWLYVRTYGFTNNTTYSVVVLCMWSGSRTIV